MANFMLDKVIQINNQNMRANRIYDPTNFHKICPFRLFM